MDDLETQLRRYADHVEDQVGQTPPFGATRRPTSSRRWSIYAAAAFLLVVGIGVATWLTGDDESSDPADEADVIIGEDDEPDTEDSAPDPEPNEDVAPQPTVGDGAWQGEWVRVTATVGQPEPLPHVVPFDDGAFILSSENRGGEMVLEIYDAETDSVRRAADGRHVWRHDPAVVWTGDELVVLAGSNGPGIDDPAIAYDPVDDSWRTLTPPPVDQLGGVDSVWTGEEILLPALELAYRPAANTWRSMAAIPNPGRLSPASVWTGAELLLWGGCRGVQCDEDPSTGVGEGIAYDPSTDTWRELPEAPIAGGANAVGVWTGEIVVFFAGGVEPGPGENFASYDPATDSWAAVPGSPFGPARLSSAVWTGEYAVFWGGIEGSTPRLGGVAVDPASGRWSEIPAAPSGGRLRTAAWIEGSLFVAGDGTHLLRFEPNAPADPAVTQVPAVTDLFADTAIQTLRNAGLDVATVFERVEPGSPAVGRVIAQAPAPFEQVAAGTIVTITVGESASEDAATNSPDGLGIDDPFNPISEGAARRIVDGLLDALAREDWTAAEWYLSNGAVTAAVWAGVPVTEETPERGSEILADYCATALCGASWEILGVLRDQTATSVEVRFSSAEGPTAVWFEMSWFEGETATVSLPPVGEVGERAPSVMERVFGDARPTGEVVVAWSETIEWQRSGESRATGWAARDGGIRAVVDELVVQGHEPVFVLEGEGDQTFLSPYLYVGAGEIDGLPYALVTDFSDGAFYAERLDDPAAEPILVTGPAGTPTVWAADVGDQLMLLLVGPDIPDQLEVRGRNGLDLAPAGTVIAPPGIAVGLGAIAPDDSSLMAIASVTEARLYRHLIQFSVEGEELGRWQLPEDEVFTGGLDFDGRFGMAPLAGGGYFVVDTVADTTRVVDVYAEVWFD